MRPVLTAIATLIREAAVAFFNSHPSRLAAAMTCYSAFSMAPLALLAVTLTAWYGRDPSFLNHLSEPLRELMGEQNARTVEGLFKLVGSGQFSVRATLLGIGSLFFGASGVFVEVQAALNTIWHASEETSAWRTYLRQRFWAFVMLLCSGVLAVASMLAFAVMTMLDNFFAERIPLHFVALRVLHSAVSLVIVSLLFALIYKLLPDVQMHWKDVLLGSLVTAILFTAGKAVMGWYLGRFALASVYGPVSALVALGFWIFYSCQIFLFGAHFTYAYACRYGTLAPPPGTNLPPLRPRPKKHRRH